MSFLFTPKICRVYIFLLKDFHRLIYLQTLD